MIAKLPRRVFVRSALAAPVLAAAASLTAGRAAATTGSAPNQTINVACDLNTLVFLGPQGPNPDDPTDVGPHPYYGASFVVQGVIYPAGVLEADPSGGLFANGDPTFPDDVIGRWYCSGHFIGNSRDPARGGIFTPTGPFVKTTQTYDLDLSAPGSRMLTSDGLELIDLNVPFQRALTGGTGLFRVTLGQVTQTAIGVNATGLFNFVFAFENSPRRSLY